MQKRSMVPVWGKAVLAALLLCTTALQAQLGGRTDGNAPIGPAIPLGTGGACSNIVINGALGSGSPDWPSVSGNQSGRLNRNGIASTCAAPKSCNIFTATGARAFDAYTFTNDSGAMACVTVDLTVLEMTASNFQVDAYDTTFNPASICTNYLADPGLSSGIPPSPVGMSFNVAAGQTFVLDVHTTNPGEIGGAYVLTVSGDICGGFCGENFDGVTAPALPAGWTATTVLDCATSNPWVNSTTTPDTAPNAVFTNDPNCVSDEVLDSPPLNYSAGAVLTFRNNRNLENNFDGGVLEISINGGGFQDILAAGGSFGGGGYNGTISSSFMNPLAGRMAWTGNSSGYFTTTVNLPAAGAGVPTVLRFRRGTDNSVSSQFWRIDSLSISPCGVCTIIPPPDVVVGNDPGQCGAVVNYPAPGGTCSPVVCLPASGSFFPVGTTPVTCSDPTGAVMESFNVTVNDIEPPSILCPADLFVVVPPGALSQPVDYATPTPTDNCPGVVGGCAPPSGSVFPIGTTTVACSATDAAANSATCAFDVTLAEQAIQQIPTASTLGLVALALLLAGAAFLVLRRHG